jgi:selenide,water dikinase
MISQEIGDLIERGCVPEGSRQNLNATTVVVDWGKTNEARRILLTDAQTSGGLLLCVAEAKLENVLTTLRKAGTPSAAVIGRIVTRRRRGPLICVTE